MTRDDYKEFFEENLLRLVHSLMRRGAPEHVAEELTMDVMTRLYHRRLGIDAPKNWVWATAHAELPGVMKKERQYVPLEDFQGDGSDPSAAVEEHAVTVEEQEEVLRLFRLLPEAQQRVLTLYYDGYTTADIARMLAIPDGTVRSNLRHGRARLKKELQM